MTWELLEAIFHFNLGSCALLGFLISNWISKFKLRTVLKCSFSLLILGSLVLVLFPSLPLFIVAITLISSGFIAINLTGFPYVLEKISPRHITYGIGIYLGASEILPGIFEYWLCDVC